MAEYKKLEDKFDENIRSTETSLEFGDNASSELFKKWGRGDDSYRAFMGIGNDAGENTTSTTSR